MMTSTQVVETSVNVTSNSPSEDYTHLDDHNLPNYHFYIIGLYLSDIPIHDATRDLILLSEQHNAESHLSQRLEILTDKLQQTARELQQEQQLTDRLLYSILPSSVANDLRLKRPVAAKKYEIVTVMFSGIVDFTHYCNQSSEPMEIVELLNETYTKFDHLADKNNEVFKVC